MSFSKEWAVLGLACALLSAPNAAWTAEVRNLYYGYQDAVKGADGIEALGSDLFGEQINLYDGTTTFHAVDVSVPTNSTLKVELARKLDISGLGSDAFGNGGSLREEAKHILGSAWELNVPHMRGVFSVYTGWVAGASSSAGSTQRCSTQSPAPPPQPGTGPLGSYVYAASSYWNGNSINLPGLGVERLLVPIEGVSRPQDGRSYYGVTKSNWWVSCLPSLKNGVGEGFSVVLPDGTRFFFDWQVERATSSVMDEYWNGASFSKAVAVPRKEVLIYATRVEDRFGNWVSYQYNPQQPAQLTSVRSNDGAEINIEYDAAGKMQRAKVGTRTWSYSYAGNYLTTVERPDGSLWSYAQSGLEGAVLTNFKQLWRNCVVNVGTKSSAQSPSPGEIGSFTIKHPSGAVGVFEFRSLVHGTNRTPGGCTIAHVPFTANQYENHTGVPKAYEAASLVRKTISGPGLDAMAWSYSYFPVWSFGWPYRRTDQDQALVDECPSAFSCNGVAKTETIAPDGTVFSQSFGSVYDANVGQALDSVTSRAGVTSTETSSYAQNAVGQPFPDAIGFSSYSLDNGQGFKNRPLKHHLIVRDGVNFNRYVNSFDAFARPLSVSSWSSLGYGRSDLTTYHDDLSRWVIGQVKSEVNADSGRVIFRRDFDAVSVLPVAEYKFDKLDVLLSYNADGTVANATNGRYLTTKFANWKRGRPQRIEYPATPESPSGSSISAVVDDNGWVSSVTDENGYTTTYGHDMMGRLSSLIYPDADSSIWNNINQSFTQVNAPDRGLPPGHWERARVEGARRTHTYYDALWRPVMTLDYDANDVSRQTQIITRYDASGRIAFQSYPTKQVADFRAALPGTTMLYDALGRMTESRQDSEHGYLYTTTEYLPGFQTRVRNPRGFETTTQYEVYDQPSYDMPRTISHPEGAITDISRNKFGQTVSLLRRNSDFSVGVWRQYVYDSHQQLCKTVEPETGATIMDYDPAGNLAWTASGISAPDLAQCNRTEGAASGRVVHRTHDARDRLLRLTFPDGNGNQSWTYTPDGLPAQITTANKGDGQAVADMDVINRYTYNKRRLLTSEWLSQVGWYNWSSSYGYDGNGNLRWHTYPTGLSVDYAPNALGQPTQVKSQADTFASGVGYYPNGAISQFTYGNGLVHRITQNARQLPREVSNGASHLIYDYDTNGNPATIRDVNAVQGIYSGNRDLAYDGLDRLTNAHLHWQLNESYAYDVLDNIKRKSDTTGAIRAYWYDASNRLTNIQNENGAAVAGLGYDVQGNLQNSNGQNYLFDFGNRLRQVAGKETYRYDGLGRRVLGRRANGTYSLSLYSQAGQLVYDERHNNPSKATDYLYLGSSLVATRERDWLGSSATIRYQHTDAMGSPVATTNQSAQIIERTNYRSYGGAIAKTVDGVGYTGHVMDAATGLAYMQQRYYDPEIGRFLSVDPVTVDSSSGNDFNRYKYARNNPYRFFDPDGRSEKELPTWVRNLIGDKPDQVDSAHAQVSRQVTRGLSEEIAAEIRTAPGQIAQAADLVFTAASFSPLFELGLAGKALSAKRLSTAIKIEKGATRASSYQIRASTTASEARSVLESNGFVWSGSRTAPGAGTMSKDNQIYYFYPSSRSERVPSAKVMIGGKRAAKVRFDAEE